MQILKTNGKFEYFHIIEKRMVFTDNIIPFIVNWNGTLENTINQYLIFKTETDWNPKSKTPINNSEYILSFLVFCEEQRIKDWRKISSTDLRKYIQYLTNKGQREGTIRTKITALYSLFNWLERFSFINLNPFNSFQNQEIKRAVNVFSNKQRTTNIKSSSLLKSIVKDAYTEDIPTKDEIKNFYERLNQEDKTMASFIISTGVRKNELLQLRVFDIENAKESPTGQSYSVFLDAASIHIKNNKSRNIMISRSLYIKIKKHLLSKEYKGKLEKFLIKNPKIKPQFAPVFISVRGNRFSDDKLNKSFKKASIETGYVEKHNHSIAPHHLRHFYASYFIYKKEESGDVNMEDVYMYLSERLGHSSVETTKNFYVKIVNKVKQQQQIEKFSEDFINGFLED